MRTFFEHLFWVMYAATLIWFAYTVNVRLEALENPPDKAKETATEIYNSRNLEHRT